MSEAITENYRHVLIRFSVDTGRIVLDFNAVKVAIYGDTEIIETDGAINKIDDVWEHQGHLQAVWRLLGRSMTGFVMDEDSFRLNFEDDAMIRAKNKKAYDFVTVYGPDPRCETGYPTAIYLHMVDPEVMEAMRVMMEGPYPKIFSPLPLTPEQLKNHLKWLQSPEGQPPIYTPPPPRPFVPHVAIGEAGKTITLDKDDEFLKFTVDPDVITLGIEGLKARFNHPFEVVDAAGRVHESIDATARSGDLDALWSIVRTNMARLEMDAESFRICFEDGAIIRSINQIDVRKPDLEQVDFWLAPDDNYNNSMPTDPQHYPANLKV
ncbi:MAG: hypothetical protein ACLQFI_09750 [Methylocella sp.]|jgi:hypothetical protein